MAKQKPLHDYLALFHTYETVKQSTGMSIKDFCADHGLSYNYTLRQFKAIREKKQPKKAKSPTTQGKRTRQGHDWEAYRIEFLRGDFKTISDFVRSKGLKPKSGVVSRNTKGWLKEKAEIRAKKREEINNDLLEEAKRRRFGELEGQVLARLHAGMKAFKTVQRFQARYDLLADKLEKEDGDEREKFRIMAFMDPRGIKEFAAATNATVEGVHKLYSLIMDFEEAGKSKQLLQKLIAGEIDVTEAALQFAVMGGNLPEAVKILLSKTQPEEPDTGGDGTPDDEELERLHQEGLRIIHRQETEFIPQRQREIEALKEEVKDHDSFAEPGA